MLRHFMSVLIKVQAIIFSPKIVSFFFFFKCMFIFVLLLPLLFATSKSGILENKSSVLMGSVCCIHVKNLSNSLKSLHLCSSGGDKKGSRKNVGLKNDVNYERKTFLDIHLVHATHHYDSVI